MHIQLPHNISTRRALIIGSLCLALIGVFGLAGAGSQSTQFWSAAHDIQVGEKLHRSDLIAISATAGNSESLYILSKKNLEGQVALRYIGKGELLPSTAVGSTTTKSGMRDLALGIQLSDLPSDLTVGDIVDLYLVPRDTHEQSEKISSGIFVERVDDRGRSLGGSVNLTLSLKDADVIYITDAISLGRIVVVRHGK